MSISLNQARDNGLAMATERGWHVFPIERGGKRPAVSGGQNDATADPEGIVRLFRTGAMGNLGIHCRPSGLYVIDVDSNPWKGKVGQASWDALVAQHGHVETYTVRTWSGGLHLYYSDAEGVLTNTAGALGPDIDTRGNGYVLGAGSWVREDGHEGTYEVLDGRPPAPLPEWIRQALQKAPVAAFARTGDLADTDLVVQRVRDFAGELAACTDGANHLAASLAVKVGNYVGAGQIGFEQAYEIMLTALNGWSWAKAQDEQTMHNTIRRQIEFGAQRNDRPWEAPVIRKNGLYDEWSGETITIDVPEPVAVVEVEKEAERAVTDWSTNLGQAHHLQNNLGVRLIHTEGVGWFRWDQKRWAPSSDAEVMSLVGEFYRKQFRSMLAKYATSEEEKWNEIAKQYKKFMSTAALNSIVAVMKTIPAVMVKGERLDAHNHLLNTPSGVVDLRDGVLRKHDPALLMTKMTRGSYRPDVPMHPDWMAALSGLPEESQDYLQLRFGQAATGYIAEDAVFLIGSGKNSKSLLLDGVSRSLGDYAYQAGEGLISTGGREGAATPEKAGLRGSRLAFIEELPEEGQLSVAELKRVVETASITARFLNQNPFTFDATHSLFVTSNYEPRVAQTDHGTWRRLCKVDFPIKFVSKPEGPLQRLADPMLKQRLTESREGQQDSILTWMVRGAMRYFADRGSVSEDRRPFDIAASTMAWRGKADRIQAYYESNLVADPAGVVSTLDVYADFTAFLAGQGHAKWALELFASRFITHEKTVDAGVMKARGPRNPDGIVRPKLPLGTGDGALQPLKPQPPIYRGIRFRTEEDDLA